MSTFDRWNTLAGVLNESTASQRMHEITTGSVYIPDEVIDHEERISDERAEFNKDGLMQGDPYVYEYQASPFPAFRVVALTTKGEASPKRSSYSKAVQRGTVFKMGSPAFTALHDRFKKFGYKLQGVDKIEEPVGEPTQGDRPEKKSTPADQTKVNNIVDDLIKALAMRGTGRKGAKGLEQFGSPFMINDLVDLVVDTLKNLSDRELFAVRKRYEDHRDRPDERSLVAQMNYDLQMTGKRRVHREQEIRSLIDRIEGLRQADPHATKFTQKIVPDSTPPVSEGNTKQNYNLLSEGKDMSTFDRWNKMAGLLNESAEPQQTVEAEETQSSTMNESDLRGMIAELAKEILSEARASRAQGEVIQRALNNLMLNQPGFPIDDDGLYGRKTSDAVKAYQRAEGLEVDGVAGPSTLFAMHTDLVNKYADSSDSAAQALISDFSFAKSPIGFKSNIVFGRRIGKAEPAKKKPAAPGENPLNRVLKNLVKRIKAGGENVDEKSVKSAMVDKMKSDPAFATNVRDLSKVANKDQFTHRLMRKISQPVMVALRTSGSDTMVASADSEEDFDWLEDSGDVGASAATPGDPVKYDDDPSSMPTLPGIDPEVFAGGIESDAGDGSGDRILTIPRKQWRESGLGTDDLDRIAKAAGVDRVVIR